MRLKAFRARPSPCTHRHREPTLVRSRTVSSSSSCIFYRAYLYCTDTVSGDYDECSWTLLRPVCGHVVVGRLQFLVAARTRRTNRVNVTLFFRERHRICVVLTKTCVTRTDTNCRLSRLIKNIRWSNVRVSGERHVFGTQLTIVRFRKCNRRRV